MFEKGKRWVKVKSNLLNKGPFSLLRSQARSLACQLFAMYSSFRAAIKVGVIYRWGFPKVGLFRFCWATLWETSINHWASSRTKVDNGVDNLADRLAKFQCYPIAFSQSESSLTDSVFSIETRHV